MSASPVFIPVISLNGVTREFSDGRVMRTVLKETNLSIYPGELTVLAGPSGSGKTTLLTIMGMVLRPSLGRVVVDGTDVTSLSEDRLATLRLKKLGFVFQQAALIQALSAFDNVLISSGIQGARITSALRQHAGELFERLGMTEYRDALPAQLSTGQQQRIGIVRALLNDPVLLLCDEPTSALDVESSKIVLDTLKRIAQDPRRGVVTVTHDPRVFPYADRLIRIEDGKIVNDTRN